VIDVGEGSSTDATAARERVAETTNDHLDVRHGYARMLGNAAAGFAKDTQRQRLLDDEAVLVLFLELDLDGSLHKKST